MTGSSHAFSDARTRPLVVATLTCLALLAVSLVGLVVDPRTITNAPAWLKPAKFGASIAVFTITLTFLVRDLPPSRLLRAATTVIGWALIVEMVLITGQAARGTTSHFNVRTPLDRTIFSTMGICIAAAWAMTMVLLWLHLRTTATDRAMALAWRFGLALHIMGAGTAWAMVQPRAEQLAAMRRGEAPQVIGSHTVGAPDGGPGLPVTGWSRAHGDLRIPHFVGMHALQLLPLLVLAMRRVRVRRDDATERRVVVLASATCAAVFLVTVGQALAGHPLLPVAASR